ncbi:Hypothetical predicted protein [Marmota monax]|uniref:Uncharacterized protein n=1 Tax=Marmota monax TaxID=9995 RepID=A0A5E4A9I0_MARMO|nr:hypothetical protein GHT09_016042 [Marmota monax]VTJ53576.1 Hypothetical predicted protein [Marmota monax]
MPAGSNEPDGVLSYQPGLPGPLPKDEGRPARDSRGRSGRLGITPWLLERMTLGRTGSRPISAASLAQPRSPGGWRAVTSVLGSSGWETPPSDLSLS